MIQNDMVFKIQNNLQPHNCFWLIQFLFLAVFKFQANAHS